MLVAPGGVIVRRIPAMFRLNDRPGDDMGATENKAGVDRENHGGQNTQGDIDAYCSHTSNKPGIFKFGKPFSRPAGNYISGSFSVRGHDRLGLSQSFFECGENILLTDRFDHTVFAHQLQGLRVHARKDHANP